MVMSPPDRFDPLRFYKCLADATRLQCVMLIHQEQELCVCELTQALQLSQPKISRHLAQLRAGELLQARREGQWVYYRINPLLPAWAKRVVGDTTEHNAEFLRESNRRLVRMGSRVERAQACR